MSDLTTGTTANKVPSKQDELLVLFSRFNVKTQEFLLVVFEAVVTKNTALLETCRECTPEGSLQAFDLLAGRFEETGK